MGNGIKAAVSFTGETFDEVHEKILKYAAKMSQTRVTPDPAQLELPFSTPTEAPKKRGPKPKAKPEATPAPEAETPTAPPVVEAEAAKPISLDDARQALKQLLNVKGMPAVQAALAKFECARISDLEESKLPEFHALVLSVLAA